MRKQLIAGNWKMNRNASESADLARDIVQVVGQQYDVETVICPPFTSLSAVARVLDSSTIKLGAQNMHPEESGAYTGEISAEMLRHLFATYVILGHSERRTHFEESDAFINAKVKAALYHRLKPILCIGETLEQRENNQTLAVVEGQLTGGLAGVEADDGDSVVIAYEPVWAIGTGKTAQPEQAQEVHAQIRSIVKDLFNENVASRLRILYGGSMKPANAEELLAQPDIDGGLIGGASLEARSFIQLVQAAAKIRK
ncbi:MAG: triose-phosphate isomerase [Opitutales bacterium]